MSNYLRVNKVQARKLYAANVEILIVGNNVNSFHFENGWHLAYSVTRERIESPNAIGSFDSFDDLVHNFEFYLDRELGRRAAYYIRTPMSQTARDIVGKNFKPAY